MSAEPKWKNYIEGIESLLTSLAILGAAWWFLFQDEANNKAKCSHSLTLVRVHSNFVWGNLEVKIENVGKRTLAIREVVFKVSQVKPAVGLAHDLMDDGYSPVLASDNRALWPVLNCQTQSLQTRILPGEVDYVYYEFAVPTNAQVLRVYSYFTTDKKRNIGWPKISVHTVKNGNLTQTTEKEE